MKSFEIEVKENDNEELYFEFPPEVLKRLDWHEDDELKFTDNKDGSFTITKIKMTDIELDFTEEEYFKFLQAAHERDMTFNEWVQEAIQDMVSRDDEELKLMKEQDNENEDGTT